MDSQAKEASQPHIPLSLLRNAHDGLQSGENRGRRQFHTHASSHNKEHVKGAVSETDGRHITAELIKRHQGGSTVSS